MSWITENFCNFLADNLNGFLDLFGEWINNIFYMMVDIALENVYYINGQRLFIALGLALIGLMSGKIVMDGYMLETAYDSEADPFNLIVRISEATAVISSSGWIFDFMMNFARVFCTDLIGVTEEYGCVDHTRNMINSVQTGTNTVGPFLLVLVVMVAALVIFSIMSGLRAGELLVMNLLFPIFAIDLLTNSRERWGNFIMGYLFAFVSYALQTFFFILAMKSYVLGSYSNTLYILSALIWLIVAIKAPQFIEKYLYKSGISNAASSGIRMVAQSAVMRYSMR